MAYIGVSPSNGVRRKHTYTATASQTTFSGAGAEGVSLSYRDSNYVDVYRNGVKLGDADYTATSGTSIVLGEGAAVNDIIEIIAYDVFSVADTVSKADGGVFDGNVTMAGTLGVTGATTLSANLNLGDNDKVIFGAGSDLEIYHNGNNSFIEDSGTGDLYIRGATSVRVQESSNNEDMIKAEQNGAVTLYHDNSPKIATTSTGIDVTGTLTVDGPTTAKLILDGIGQGDNEFAQIHFYNSDGSSDGPQVAGKISMTGNAAGVRSDLDFWTAPSNTGSEGADPLQRMRISHDGDISFYEDTGTTAKLFWDASTERLGIGTASPANALHVKGVTTVAYIESTGVNGDIQLEASGTTGYTAVRANNNDLSFLTATAEHMRIDSSGNVGIGTSSPSANLDVFHNSGRYQRFVSSTADLELLSNNSSTPILYIKGTGTADFVNVFDDTTEVFTISDGGKVEVGLSTSTGTYFEAGGTGNSAELRKLVFTASTTTNTGDTHTLNAESSSGNIALATASSERMRIDASGNVGIGTSSPAVRLSGTVLTIDDTSVTGIELASSGASAGEMFSDTSNTIISERRSGSIIFRTVGTNERVRIDSNGNLLVGKTVPASGTEGVEAKSDGSLYATKDIASGGQVGIFNRLTSDGHIVSLRKDGLTVGILGSSNTDQLVVGTPDGSEMGVRFDGDLEHILPTNASGAKKDALADLGSATARWRNIYLSGGVYVGGTGSANKLDDYEEGTWTVTFFDASGGGNASSTTTTGYYTKVGNKVTACFDSVLNINTTGMTSSNNLYMSLPFAASSTGGSSGSFAPQSITFRLGDGMLVPVVQNSAGRVRFYSCATGAGIANNRVAELSTGVSDMLNFSITYFTS